MSNVKKEKCPHCGFEQIANDFCLKCEQDFYANQYTVLHLTVLLPLKFYALATVNMTGWGTRPAALKEVKANG